MSFDKDSPFVAAAWNPFAVIVEDIKSGILGRPNSFHINRADAGPGDLEVMITCHGETVKSTAYVPTGSGIVEVTYTPEVLEPHNISIKFNGKPVSGSPFTSNVITEYLSVANGPGLGLVKASVPTKFTITTKYVGNTADVHVDITAPSGQFVPSNITGSYSAGFNVEYTPVETGQHTVDIKYADMSIKDSPFHSDVFDPMRVYVSQLPFAIINKAVSFKVDASQAGTGQVNVTVEGNKSRPNVDINADHDGIYLVSFTPTESIAHNVVVKFNDADVPGSPFKFYVIDPKQLCVNFENIALRPVNTQTMIQLDTYTAPVMPVECTITDPQGQIIPTTEQKNGTVHVFQFTPDNVGSYQIMITYGEEPVPGCPFICNTYDTRLVRIIDITQGANVGQAVGFTVDSTDAGPCPVDVDVTNDGMGVPVHQEQRYMDKQRFIFQAKSPTDYIIDVHFNKESVEGCPFSYKIINPASSMTVYGGNTAKSVAIGQVVWTIISSPNGQHVNKIYIKARIKGPIAGQCIPFLVTEIPNGNIKVEYTSITCGPHTLNVEYAGQLIPGCPIVTNLFDPNEIQLEGPRARTTMDPLIRDHVSLADNQMAIWDISSSLSEFIRKNDLKSATSVLDIYSDKDRKTIVEYNNYEVLSVAVECNNRAFVEFLVQKCLANIQEAMSLTAQYGKLEILKTLIAYGGNIHEPSTNGRTPIFNACSSISLGQIKVVKYLIEQGANINELDQQGESCLMISVARPVLCKLLIQNGALVNAQDHFGDGALHRAIIKGNLETIELLLESGSDPYLKNAQGDDAFRVAIFNRDVRILNFLLMNRLITTLLWDINYRVLLANYIITFSTEKEKVLVLWREILEMKLKNPGVKLPEIEPSPVCSITMDIKTLEELNSVGLDLERFHQYALENLIRIVGLNHKITTDCLIHVSNILACEQKYQRSFDLLKYAFKLMQERTLTLNDECFRVLNMLYRVCSEGTFTVEFNEVFDIFNLVTFKIPFIKNEDGFYTIEISMQLILRFVFLIIQLNKTPEQMVCFEQAICRLTRSQMKDENCRSFLHHAVYRFCNFRGVAKLLLECGADVNALDRENNSVLHLCTSTRLKLITPPGYFQTNHQIFANESTREEAIKLFLQYRADVDVINDYGELAGEYLNVRDHVNLRCLAAVTIRDHYIPYVGKIAADLEKFVRMHGRRRQYSTKLIKFANLI